MRVGVTKLIFNCLVNMSDIEKVVEEAVIAFKFDGCLLVDSNGLQVGGTGVDKIKTLYKDLYNAAFFDPQACKGLYEHLKVSILPQIQRQGDKLSIKGLIEDELIYSFYFQSSKTTKDIYLLSKEVDKFVLENVEGQS